MATLISKTKSQTLLANLQVAESFSSRAKGLIGTKHLDHQSGLWIPRCNWIHTFFMSIPIDVVYLNKKNIVKKLQSRGKTWRLFAPVVSACTVIEMAEGQIENLNIEIGDHLYVGD